MERWRTIGVLATLSASLCVGCIATEQDLAQDTAFTKGKSAIDLRAVGDVMMGTSFPAGYLPPENGDGMFDGVKPLVEGADLVFANLEGPLCDGGSTSKCSADGNCYAFRTPTRYIEHLVDFGVDLASLANNHALDFGESCRGETIQTLDAHDIVHSGPPGSIATAEARGLRVAMVAFHTARHSNYLNDHESAAVLVSEAADDHDVVIVSFHGGAEGSQALHVPDGRETFYGEDRGDLRRFSRAVIAAGADLVLGHGPHVPRALEIVNGRLVAYSLGNFATYGRFSLAGPKGLSFVLDVSLDREGQFVSGKLLPTNLVRGGYPVIYEEGAAIPLVASLTDDDFPNSGVIIDADGTLHAQD
jgi:hypothetical protein